MAVRRGLFCFCFALLLVASVFVVAPSATAGKHRNCTPGYKPCLKRASDYDCKGGTGDGPKYTGKVRVTGSDPYGLDSDNDGWGCEDS
jgi:hypothetical protein